jgi:hypothetical protein
VITEKTGAKEGGGRIRDERRLPSSRGGMSKVETQLAVGLVESRGSGGDGRGEEGGRRERRGEQEMTKAEVEENECGVECGERGGVE